MIFDTHAHYDDEAFDEDRDSLLNGLYEAGIGTVVNVAASMRSCLSTLELANKFGNVYAAVGVHPSETHELTQKDMETLEEYCKLEKVVAVGEIGLDYHYDDTDEAQQKKCFEWQLDVARRVGLPVIIHSRDAAADTMDIMKAEKTEELGGVIHCYSYSYEMAKQYVDMGFFIGVGGVVTFKNSKKLKECVEKLPLESIVLETDCPYLAPEPYRGKRNSSLNLDRVVSEVARLKNIDEEEVIRVTTANANVLYRMNR